MLNRRIVVLGHIARGEAMGVHGTATHTTAMQAVCPTYWLLPITRLQQEGCFGPTAMMAMQQAECFDQQLLLTKAPSSQRHSQ